MDEIKDTIEKVNNKTGEYGKDFMKIKFNSDDNLPLKKVLKLHNLTIVSRSIFEEDCKCYSQDFFRWMFVWIINVRVYLRRNSY